MYHRKEKELDPTDWSETSDKSIVMAPNDASSAFLVQKLNTQIINVMERGDETPHHRYLQDSRIRLCRHCSREFKSDKALYGHLRIHSQHQAKSKAGAHHLKSTKLARKHSPEEEEEENEKESSCFLCDDSFSSMKLLCQHKRNYHDKDSDGIQQPIPSQESNSLGEPETIVKEGTATVSPRNDQNEGSHIDLLKHLLNWSQTGKRGRKKTVSDNIIYNAVPLRVVYYGSAVPQTERRLEDSHDSNQSLFTRKKQKIEETMPYQDTSMDSELGAADTETTVSMMPLRFETRISNKSKSSSCQCHGGRLKNPKRPKAVKGVHQCEICGKTFETGQALGGHKTSHRVKPVVDPLRFEVVQGKTKKQLCGESGQVREYVTRMLLPGPGVLSEEEADVSEESHQEHPKRMRDFDLNIPYEG